MTLLRLRCLVQERSSCHNGRSFDTEMIDKSDCDKNVSAHPSLTSDPCYPQVVSPAVEPYRLLRQLEA